ncbi:MAG: hypothetical protein M1834_001105 [Cirrosporium novae-zelandiae]|nr:MAG: hypothetical protein M1834_001105 [Cirrosporium novae-zelandiae]
MYTQLEDGLRSKYQFDEEKETAEINISTINTCLSESENNPPCPTIDPTNNTNTTALNVLSLVRDGSTIPDEDLRSFIQGIASGTVPDYQAAAFLMAVYNKGLSDSSTATLTLAMRDSGQVINLSSIPGIKIDKHSTGGVGDKISLALAPWVAACGIPVPMISGRSLGHTGGTLDKLSSIPGFHVDLSLPEFYSQMNKIGVAIIGQTTDLAPADKKLYALRDVTATIESIPLITASILSKKLAEGIDSLVLDVKVGRGAFMKDLPHARQLAWSLIRVGSAAGIRVRALLTNMDAPLGTTIGNALEVHEAIDILHGRGPHDTTELTLALASEMLVLGGVAPSLEEARKKLLAIRDSGAAASKFAALVAAQGGNPAVVTTPELILPKSRFRTPIYSDVVGTVTAIDALDIAAVAARLGAGHMRTDDIIDPAVGVTLRRTINTTVKQNSELAVLHHNAPLPADAISVVRKAFVINNNDNDNAAERVEVKSLVLETLG